MEKELWLDKQEIEQLLTGTLFWQDVQNRANIKVVHSLMEENISDVEKQAQSRAFLKEKVFSVNAELDNIAAEPTKPSEETTPEAEIAAAQTTGPVLTREEEAESAAEEFSEEVIVEEVIEEVIEEVTYEGKTIEEEVISKEEKIILAVSKEKIVYSEETPLRKSVEAIDNDLHNTMSFSWESGELPQEEESGTKLEKMERSLEKTFGNGNEFKKLILERELEDGFEDRPIGGIKMFILLGVFAAITIGVWVFFLSK